MGHDTELRISVPDWVKTKLREQADALGIPLEGLARSFLENGLLRLGGPAPSPAPPTIHEPQVHHPQPSGAPPTIHEPQVHHPQPSGAPPTIHEPQVYHPEPSGAPPTIHTPKVDRPGGSRVVGWRELTMDRRRSCASCGKQIRGGENAFVAMDEDGTFGTAVCADCFAKRSKS